MASSSSAAACTYAQVLTLTQTACDDASNRLVNLSWAHAQSACADQAALATVPCDYVDPTSHAGRAGLAVAVALAVALALVAAASKYQQARTVGFKGAERLVSLTSSSFVELCALVLVLSPAYFRGDATSSSCLYRPLLVFTALLVLQLALVVRACYGGQVASAAAAEVASSTTTCESGGGGGGGARACHWVAIVLAGQMSALCLAIDLARPGVSAAGGAVSAEWAAFMAASGVGHEVRPAVCSLSVPSLALPIFSTVQFGVVGLTLALYFLGEARAELRHLASARDDIDCLSIVADAWESRLLAVAAASSAVAAPLVTLLLDGGALDSRRYALLSALGVASGALCFVADLVALALKARAIRVLTSMRGALSDERAELEKVNTALRDMASSSTSLARAYTSHLSPNRTLSSIVKTWNVTVQVAVQGESSVPTPRRIDGVGCARSGGDADPSDPLSGVMAAAFPERAAADYLEQLRAAAARIRDVSYTVRHFHDDMVGLFPELRLYLGLGGDDDDDPSADTATMSGRSSADEYHRTIGALFSVYWLCRLELPSVSDSEGLNGQGGYCFGFHGSQWAEYTVEGVTASVARGGGGGGGSVGTVEAAGGNEEMAFLEKALKFHTSVDWEQMNELMVDAGLLEWRQCDDNLGDRRALDVCVPRMMAMLALTAIHDLMKVAALCPAVDAAHAPYRGVQAGATILDHDMALAYVLEHRAESLPCFHWLPDELRRPILFTQAKLEFNHGWLVQAEAPPGPMLRTMKAVLSENGTAAADVAFYFAHWLTDLSGGEPPPHRGALKFTQKFPTAVLKMFVRSFPILKELSQLSVTQLNETFLRQWWPHELLGEAPTGPCAVGWMRLVVQAQTPTNQEAIDGAMAALEARKRIALSRELALTGVHGEAYAESRFLGGPAILVYYSPAFLQASGTCPSAALHALAEIYAAARELWPLRDEDQGRSVTVHVGVLRKEKAVDLSAVYAKGFCWILEKKTDADAQLRKCRLTELTELVDEGTPFRVLELWGLGEVEAEAVKLMSSGVTAQMTTVRRRSSLATPSSFRNAASSTKARRATQVERRGVVLAGVTDSAGQAVSCATEMSPGSNAQAVSASASPVFQSA